MNRIQCIRRLAGVLAGLASALLASAAATPAALAVTLPPLDGPAGTPAQHVPVTTHIAVIGGTPRLADHPDRRRGRAARRHGGGAHRPGTKGTPAGDGGSRLNHAFQRSGSVRPAGADRTEPLPAALARLRPGGQY